MDLSLRMLLVAATFIRIWSVIKFSSNSVVVANAILSTYNLHKPDIRTKLCIFDSCDCAFGQRFSPPDNKCYHKTDNHCLMTEHYKVNTPRATLVILGIFSMCALNLSLLIRDTPRHLSIGDMNKKKLLWILYLLVMVVFAA